MKLKELKYFVDSAMKWPGGEDHNVVVQMNEPGIPTQPMVAVATAHNGFDWTNGMFIITTEQPVIRKPNDSQTNKNKGQK